MFKRTGKPCLMLFPCLLINIFRVIVVHLDDTIMVFGSKNNNLFFAGKAFPPKNGRKIACLSCCLINLNTHLSNG